MHKTISIYLAALIITIAGSAATLGVVEVGTSRVLSSIMYVPHENATLLYAAVRSHRFDFHSR